MSRQRSKWMTAGLLAATAGLWGTAFIAPEFHLDPNDVSDCRGLGIMAGVALIVWVMIVPLLRQNAALLRAWSFFGEGEAAARGEQPGGGLRPVVGDRDVS